MAPGSAVWLALGLAVAAWTVIEIVRRRSAAIPGRLVGWLVGSWLGRIVMLGVWAEVGWHLFTQRP
jgi:hypothetical protein